VDFGEIVKPIKFILEGKPAQLQGGDILEFYEINNSKRFVKFRRKDNCGQNHHILYQNQIFFNFEQSEEIMALIMAGRELGFKLFKKELHRHVYILQNLQG